ncbi:hypothetical protein VTI74DRAFT_2627 [Chaetomium olivicolor]
MWRGASICRYFCTWAGVQCWHLACYLYRYSLSSSDKGSLDFFGRIVECHTQSLQKLQRLRAGRECQPEVVILATSAVPRTIRDHRPTEELT